MIPIKRQLQYFEVFSKPEVTCCHFNFHEKPLVKTGLKNLQTNHDNCKVSIILICLPLVDWHSANRLITISTKSVVFKLWPREHEVSTNQQQGAKLS